jgi:hypothetical protein
MKPYRLLLPLFGLLLMAPIAAAEVIVIEAPWLVGTVTPASPPLNGSIELPAGATLVLSASLHLSGVATEGTFQCFDDPEVYPAPVVVEGFFTNDCIGQVSGAFRAEIQDVVGEVTLEVPVTWTSFAGDPAPWSCWLDEPVSVEVYWAYGLVGICFWVDPPTLEITEARFEIEVEQAVPVLPVSWSAVKTVYR